MTSTATLARALTLQNEGRVAEAVAMYRELLAREPLDGDALHLLGVAVARLGQTQEAVRLIGAAGQLQPSHAPGRDRESTRLDSSHRPKSYRPLLLQKKNIHDTD